jgi:hypothetical protein
MLDRELRYKVPFERLNKLSRSMSRKAFGRTWWATWAWVAIFLAACFAGPSVEEQLKGTGWPDGAGVFVLLGVFFVGLIVIRSWGRKEAKSRADYDAEATLRQEPGGLRISTNTIEYYLRWAGIAQMLIEPDGLVVSHGNLFFLVPNSAFASPAERDQLVRDVFDNLSPQAKDRSAAHVRSVLARDTRTA